MLSLLLLPALIAPARAVEPSAPPVPVAASAQVLPLTSELLARWGYDADKVVALPPEKRAQLQKDVTQLEIGRLRRLELLRKIKPDHWRLYVTEQELLTPEGMKLVDDYLASLKDKPMLVPAQVKDFQRADGKPLTPEDFAAAQALLDHMFDGVAAHGADLSGDVVVDAHVRNETIYDMTITSPKTGLSVSVGQLFVDQRHPQATNSPYVNLGWGADSKPDSWVDYRFKASLGYVDLHSRFFADPPSPAPTRVLELGKSLGMPQDQIDKISPYMTYDDPYKAHGIIVTSLLSELGRAYNLFGPVDVSWTVGNLIKTMWVAPNAAFDETLGLRVRMNDGLSLGIFGGIAQNVSPVGNHLFQELIANNTIKPGLNVENAPHASIAVWGKMPGVSDMQFSVAGTQRWNNDTQVHEVTGSLMTTFWKHPIALQGSYARETGTAIEFDRQKARAELDYHLSENSQAFLAYERDHIKYGNAEVKSDAFLAGFKVDFGKSGSGVTFDHLFGGEYKGTTIDRQHMQSALTAINQNLTSAMNVVDKANAAYVKMRPDLNPAALEAQLNDLSRALTRLDPDTATHLIDELSKHGLSDAQRQALMNLWLRTVAPGNAYYTDIQNRLAKDQQLLQEADKILHKADEWSKWYDAHRADIKELAALLTSEQVWDAAVIQAARGQMLKALAEAGKIKIPIMGGINLQMDAPAILAAANVLNSRLSPIAPVKAGQIDGWLLREAGVELGIGPNATEQQVASALFGLADTQMKQQIAQNLGPLMNQIGSLTPKQLADQILADVPPPAAALLKQRYGVDLAGLIPPNLPPDKIKDIINGLPDQVTKMLEQKYGAELAKGIGQALAWAGDLLRREINMTMIQLLLASEELNRLTVDHGQKINDLDLRMAMRSFDMLDARNRQQAINRVQDLKAAALDAARSDDRALGEKFIAHGKEALRELELDPAWPQGLKVEVEEKSWLPILTLYGDGGLFDLIGKIKKVYESKPRPQGMTITFNFRADQEYGSSIWRDTKKGTVRYDLGRPRDARDAAFKLEHLEDHIDG